MAKAYTLTGPDSDKVQAVVVYCPGCDTHHAFEVPRWNWNGSLDAPTFTPSMLVWPGDPVGGGRRCHSFVTDGKIQYLNDCFHDLKGQTIDLPEVD